VRSFFITKARLFVAHDVDIVTNIFTVDLVLSIDIGVDRR